MTIKEVEEKTKLARSNIRFYEKERLIEPKRAENGYRDYSDDDVERLIKIAWLRTLGISVEDIRKIIMKQMPLQEAVQNRTISVQEEIVKLKKSEQICNLILQNGELDFENLNIEAYTSNLERCWKENKNVFCMDSVGFFFVWGGFVVWLMITAISFLIAIIIFQFLPTRIPIQWSMGEVSQTASKWFIFIYPTACIIIRFLLRPFLAAKLWKLGCSEQSVTNYITNYLCLLSLIVESFTIVYLVFGIGHVQLWIVTSSLFFAGVLLLVQKSVNKQYQKSSRGIKYIEESCVKK